LTYLDTHLKASIGGLDLKKVIIQKPSDKGCISKRRVYARNQPSGSSSTFRRTQRRKHAYKCSVRPHREFVTVPTWKNPLLALSFTVVTAKRLIWEVIVVVVGSNVARHQVRAGEL
jgi:hypothetical protein